MGSLKLLAIAGALASVTASHALAGDLPPPSVIPDAPTDYGVSSEDSGVYLRGDIGVGINTVGSLSVVPTGTFNSLSTGGATLSESTTIGAGIGYAYNGWLRFDATAEYRAGGRLGGRDQVNFNSVPNPPSIDQFNFYEANHASAVGLVNAYVDLGTFCQLGCITPYVGAGIGYGYSWISGLTDNGLQSQGPGAPFGSGAFIGTTSGRGKGSGGGFAWALMAGLGYQVNDKLTMDLGYRYLDLGDSPTVAVVNNVSGLVDGSVKWKKMTSHDIRIGMRWTLDGGDCCGTPSEPLTRKY
jgi:opacity protein-like surface antigen